MSVYAPTAHCRRTTHCKIRTLWACWLSVASRAKPASTTNNHCHGGVHAPFCCWLYCLLLGGFTIAPQLKVLHLQLNTDSEEPGEGGEVAAMQLT